MKLNRITLKNFQKTVSLDQSFSDGINVITGLTDTGKTVLSNAIMWLFGFLTMSENDFRKEDTKETLVEGWLDNGFRIERIRSDSVNRYILKKEGCDDKVFDNFGKNPPEEIRKALEMSEIEIDGITLNLNFSSQDNLNFLLDKRVYPASFSAKLFNKLTGNELLDDLFKECNRDSLKFNKELKQTKEKLANQEEELVDYSQQYKELKKKRNLVKTKFDNIKEKVEVYEELEELADEIKANKENREFIQFKVDKIKIVSDEKIEELKKLAKEFKSLQDIFYDLEVTEDALQKVEKQIKGIKIINVDFEGLKKKCQELKEIGQLSYDMGHLIKKQKEMLQNINKIQEKIKSGEKELKEIWNKCKVCPLCKTRKELK